MEYNKYPAGYAPVRREFQSKRDATYAPTACKIIQELKAEGRTDIKVLDFGCGPGSITMALADNLIGHGRVIGIDREPSEIAYALKNIGGRSNVEFFTENIYKFSDDLGNSKEKADTIHNKEYELTIANKIQLDFPENEFDIVHTHAVLDYFTDERARMVVKELCRVCSNKGGTIITTLPNWDKLCFNFNPDEPLEQRSDGDSELIKSFHRRFKKRIEVTTGVALRSEKIFMDYFNEYAVEIAAKELDHVMHHNKSDTKLLDLWVRLFINTLTSDDSDAYEKALSYSEMKLVEDYTKAGLFDEIAAVCKWAMNPEAYVKETWYEMVAIKRVKE